jgi:hypothetical protein
MSLIITSNKALENAPEFSEAFKPYSYQNRLLNTMRIPPNSEIALQSAKINKNGLFVLDRSNSGFCNYFGTPVEDVFSKDINDTTTQPFRGVIGSGEAFREGDVKNEVNVEDMANQLQRGLDQATFHPSLIGADGKSKVVVSTNYDATGLNFEGFKFTATQQTAKTKKATIADDAFVTVAKNDEANFTQAAGSVTSTTTKGFIVQNREHPISQNDGECVFDFSGMQANGRWMVGLSRINKPCETTPGDFEYVPNYFEFGLDKGIELTGRKVRGMWRYADICVARIGNDLRIFQSGSRTIGTGDGIYMNEVIYYGAHNENFPTIIDASTAGFTKVKFSLTNEELTIEVAKGAGAYTILCDFTTMTNAVDSKGAVKTQALKNQCLNPVNAAKWAMYPMMAANGDITGGAQVLTLESIEHYTDYPKYTDATYYNHDWWGWSQQYNETVFCRELEKRAWNNFSRTTTEHGFTTGPLTGKNGLLEPKLLNAGLGMEDYDNLIITARSEAYGNSTDETNTQDSLGFMGEPVSNPVLPANDLITTNQSSTVPRLTSNISLFIRLNNFTQNSINARQGTISKIVSHLPRFDNSGNETGGLYFEPHEKTYLALNNPEEILINSFDVDIVYENETLCTALTGKTIICFHIRKMK